MTTGLSPMPEVATSSTGSWITSLPGWRRLGFGQLEVLQTRSSTAGHSLVFTCHPQEMTADRIAKSGEYCTWSLPSPGLTGPWNVTLARPFAAEPDLFAAPLVLQRDGNWVIIGFRKLEPKGIDAFEILDPIPVF